jgi:hypothetical protein
MDDASSSRSPLGTMCAGSIPSWHRFASGSWPRSRLRRVEYRAGDRTRNSSTVTVSDRLASWRSSYTTTVV